MRSSLPIFGFWALQSVSNLDFLPLNRVRVWEPWRHTPILNCREYPPWGGGGEGEDPWSLVVELYRISGSWNWNLCEEYPPTSRDSEDSLSSKFDVYFLKTFSAMQWPFSRHSKSNVLKSNSIQLNPWIEFDWVDRQSNEIEHQTFSEFNFRTNRTQSNSIHLIVFDWARKPNSIEHNLIDWVRLALVNLYKASPKQAHQSRFFLCFVRGC